MVAKKIKKNLNVLPWLAEMLDNAGERHGGPGEVASAAIYAFCTASQPVRASIINAYHHAKPFASEGKTNLVFEDYISQVLETKVQQFYAEQLEADVQLAQKGDVASIIRLYEKTNQKLIKFEKMNQELANNYQKLDKKLSEIMAGTKCVQNTGQARDKVQQEKKQKHTPKESA